MNPFRFSYYRHGDISFLDLSRRGSWNPRSRPTTSAFGGPQRRKDRLSAEQKQLRDFAAYRLPHQRGRIAA
jgi:hypothetical protein